MSLPAARSSRARLGALAAAALLLAGAALADDFVRVRPGETSSLSRRPRRGQREVLHRKGVFVDMVADDALLEELMERGYEVEVLQENLDQALETLARPDAGPYHRHHEMLAEMRAWVAAAPELVRVEVIGHGSEVLPGGGRREIPVARFRAPGPARRPKVLLFGGVHAREVATTEVLLMIGRHLVERAGAGGEVASLLATRELWILPALNPDGREYCFREDPWWRKNRSGVETHARGTVGVDLNRNFSYEWGRNAPRGGSSGLAASGIYRGPEPFSEPETRALRDLVRRVGFDASLSLHSYGRMILVPFGYDRREPDHRALYAELERRLVEATGYVAGSVQEVLGYYSNGRHDDWLYADRAAGKTMVAAAELEIGSSFFPHWHEVRACAVRIARAAFSMARFAGADLETVASLHPRPRGELELAVDVTNRGVRAAREVEVWIERIPAGDRPLAVRSLGDLGGLEDPRRDAPAVGGLRFPLERGVRAVRVRVGARGEPQTVEELVVPAVD